jgi:hypothetical protein
MGLTDTIKAGVSAGFRAAGDVKVPATFTRVTGTAYNPETGTNVEITVDYEGIEGFRRQYTLREIEVGIAQAGDIRFVVMADDLGFYPKTIDRVTINGVVYQIQEVQPDPVSATVAFRLRT